MFGASLSTAFLLALAIAAHPVVQRDPLKRLSVVKRINPQAGPYNIVQRDQQRIRSLKARAEGLEARVAISSPATNAAVSYTASVGVGSPATQFTLVVDTGSSNTWVGAGTAYVQTGTSQQTADTVSVSYGSGSFSGNEFIDHVDLGNGLVINEQSIGVATTSTGFPGVDGIIGVGPVGLTQNTLSPDAESTIPTITDNLFTSGVIGANILGVSFEPTTSANSETNGELTWGGTDPTKSTGEITYTPITTTFPANTFWGIDTSVAYGSASILGLTAGIVDTGTTLVQLATDAFQVYQSATGGVADSATGLLSLTPAQFENLQSLFFTVAGTSFEFTANAQILPRILNSQMGGTPDGIYLIVSDLGTNSGAGLDFILGQTFLERFYSVYDTDNQRVGLATTPFTDATSN